MHRATVELLKNTIRVGYAIVSRGIHECIPQETLVYFMTVVLWPTRAYEQRDKLVTLQWSSSLWDVISLQTALEPFLRQYAI